MTTKSLATLDNVRKQLTALAELGDNVTTDDVIDAAGKLVSQGIAPHDMAVLLSDMPEGGQALAQWVSQHAEGAAQREQQVKGMHSISQHELGVSAARVLMHHPELQPSAAPPSGPDLGSIVGGGTGSGN